MPQLGEAPVLRRWTRMRALRTDDIELIHLTEHVKKLGIYEGRTFVHLLKILNLYHSCQSQRQRFNQILFTSYTVTNRFYNLVFTARIFCN